MTGRRKAATRGTRKVSPIVFARPPGIDASSLPSTANLLKLPYAFTQEHLLTETQLRQAAERRGVHMRREHLEQLHRRGLLVPLLRIHNRPVSTPIPQPNETPGPGWDVGLAAHQGRLTDPAQTRYRRWPKRDDGYRYSHFQLIALKTLGPAIPTMPAKRTPDGPVLDLPPQEKYFVEHGEGYRALAVVAEVLATRYLPRVRHTISDSGDQFAGINALTNDHDPVAECAALNQDPDDLLAEAEMLLHEARRMDPLGDWSELVRAGNPRRWNDLRYDALIALDKRIVAELIFKYLEDSAEQNRAKPLASMEGMLRQARHDRLTIDDQERSETQLQFGMHERPALVLAVEGETEELIVPRVLKLFGEGEASGLIQVVSLNGVDGDVRLLARAVAAPRLVADPHGAKLMSTATALMVAVDPEKKYATVAKCEAQHKAMVDEVMRSLVPDLRRKQAVRKAVEYCIRVHTWGSQSFEYAHFSDHELAIAARRLCKGAPPLAEVTARFGAGRPTDRNLKDVWKKWPTPVSKVDLADELWPILRRRLVSGRGRPAPIGPIVDEALALAHEARGVRIFEVLDP